MQKAMDLAEVTAGEPAHGLNDVSTEVRHVVHGTDNAAVDGLRQLHIVGVYDAESVPWKSISVESADNLSEHEPARWPQIAHSNVEGEGRIEGCRLNEEHALPPF
jgi:hypothetical protein